MKKILLIVTLALSGAAISQTASTSPTVKNSAPIRSAIEYCHHEEVVYLDLLKKETTNPGKNSQLGSITATAYAITKEPDGPQIGLTIGRRIDLGLKDVTYGPHSMFEVAATNFLPDGSITTSQVTDFDKEISTNLIKRAIVGGTGKYLSVRGEIVLEPHVLTNNKTQYKATLNMYILCDRINP